MSIRAKPTLQSYIETRLDEWEKEQKRRRGVRAADYSFQLRFRVTVGLAPLVQEPRQPNGEKPDDGPNHRRYDGDHVAPGEALFAFGGRTRGEEEGRCVMCFHSRFEAPSIGPNGLTGPLQTKVRYIVSASFGQIESEYNSAQVLRIYAYHVHDRPVRSIPKLRHLCEFYGLDDERNELRRWSTAVHIQVSSSER